MNPKITLVDWPRWPIETIYYLWETSRHNKNVMLPQEIHEKCKADPEYNKEIRKVFEQVIDSPYPIAENLWFVFLLEGVSISFREQMVRHRVGVKVGERVGMDIVPELGSSSWWSQSMRYTNVGRFCDKSQFRMPESVEGNPEAYGEYLLAMQSAQESYNKLVQIGIPIEDAREVIPLGATHSISWGINLLSLAHILRKRSCWILQLGVWGPVIRGMISELREKVDPYFSNLVTPPCMKGDEFKGCVAKLDNEERQTGKDPLPPCSLFLRNHPELILPEYVHANKIVKFKSMREDFSSFWHRDPETGKRLA
jgi:thymidylate synthase (FAD)